MGLFSWLFGQSKSYQELPPKIIRKRESKFELLGADCSDWLTKAEKVFVVCHFDESLESAKEIFDRNKTNFESVEFELNVDGLQRLVSAPSLDSIILIHSQHLNLSPSTVATELVSGEKEAVILVAEIPPVQSQDMGVYRLAENLRCRCQIRHYISLEDFLFEVTAGPGFKEMLDRLGFNDDEVIENRMIGRRVKHAQKRLLNQSPPDSPNSEQAWFEKYPVIS